MSRRKFIKQSSALAGGLLLHHQMLKAFASSYTDQKITVGIIGCGDRGKGIMHIMNELSTEFSITAICDILDFRIEETKKANPSSNYTIYKDYRKLLDDKNVDAVIIATPLNMHYDIATDALKAGKHVYLEKTMTYNITQAIQLVKLCKQYPKQTLQVGHQYRYSPLYFKVKDYIEKDYLGKVTQIDCRWDRNWNWRRPVPAGITDRQINWRMYKEYSGGLAAELLSHQMDFINWTFNTHPDEILGTGGIDYYKDGRETYDNQQVMLRYNKAGMIGNFGATCANAHDGYIFKIKGTKGSVHLLVDDGVYFPESSQKKKLETVDGVTGATKIEWNKDGGIPLLNEKLKDGTWYALKDFYKSIAQKITPASNVITGATTAVCVHLSNMATYNHTIQNWKPEYIFS
jgi:predicted dehydrogenase